MIDVTLRLEDGSLEHLLAGELAAHVWLREEEPGVYRLNVGTYSVDDGPGAVSARALLRLLASGRAVASVAPPLPEPTPEEAALLADWQALFATLPSAGATS